MFNQIIEKTNDSWDLRYRELKEYHNANGNSDVPARYENRALGTWCVAQRVRFNAGKLSAIEIKKLKNLDFNFKPRKDNFKYFTKTLVKFKSKYGHCDVPIHSDDFQKLGKLVNRYRHIYKKGVKRPDGSIYLKYIGKLKKEDIQKLNDIGFKWQVRRRNWLNFYNEIKEYFDLNGNLKGLQKENNSLYIWLYNQQKKLNKLPKDKIEKLNAIDINSFIKKSEKTNHSSKKQITLNIQQKLDFTVSEKIKEPSLHRKPVKNKSWDEYYIQLIDYKIKNSDTYVSRNNKNYKGLGYWVYKQRLEFEKNTLDENRISKLKEIGFDFNIKGRRLGNAWTKHYDELKDFYSQNKHSHYTKSDGNPTLYHWVLAQRVDKRKNKLKLEKVKKLDEINFVWEPDNIGTLPDDDNWLNHLIKLREYKDKFGHTNVSQVDKNPEYKKLGKWLNEQRNYKKGRKLGKRIVFLSEEKEALLNGLGIIWDVKEHEWNQRLEELKNYHKEFNSWKVPLNGKKFGGLGHWIYRIRKNGTTSERAEKLKNIGYDVTELLIKN